MAALSEKPIFRLDQHGDTVRDYTAEANLAHWRAVEERAQIEGVIVLAMLTVIIGAVLTLAYARRRRIVNGVVAVLASLVTARRRLARKWAAFKQSILEKAGPA